MKKFNGYENHIISGALKLFAEQAEQLVTEAEAKNNGKTLIYGPGYFEMVCKNLKEKVDNMTLKSHLKDTSND